MTEEYKFINTDDNWIIDIKRIRTIKFSDYNKCYGIYYYPTKSTNYERYTICPNNKDYEAFEKFLRSGTVRSATL